MKVLSIGKYNKCIHNLIAKKDWSNIRKVLQQKASSPPSSPRNKVNNNNDDIADYESKRYNLLGMAVGYLAPLDILQGISKQTPNLITQKDIREMIPLHIACINGAPIEVVKWLIKQYNDQTNDSTSSSTLVTTKDGKLPIHYAVEYICQSNEDKENTKHSAPNDKDVMRFTVVIQYLCSLSPHSIRIKDNKGHSPLDIVQMVKCQYQDDKSPMFQRAHKVYRIMRAHNIQLYLKEKKQAEETIKIICSSQLTDVALYPSISSDDTTTYEDSITKESLPSTRAVTSSIVLSSSKNSTGNLGVNSTLLPRTFFRKFFERPAHGTVRM